MAVEKIKLPVGGIQTIKPIEGSPVVPITIPEGALFLFENVEYPFDKDGNALDKEGKIFKPSTDIQPLLKEHPEYLKPKVVTTDEDPFKEGATLELDDITLTINKDGSAVDKDGKVIKTKAELKVIYDANNTSDSTDVDYIKEIQTKTNLIITGDNGTPIEYENSVEGLTQYTKDVYQIGLKSGIRQQEEAIYNKYPIIKDVIAHLQLNGGTLKNFNEDPAYDKITLDDKNVDQLTSVYVMSQVKRGIPEAEAIATAKYLKDDNKLVDFAKSGLAYLIQNKQQESIKTQQLIQAQESQEQEQSDIYWNEINNSIKVKKIKLDNNEFVFPEVVRVKTADGKVETKSLNDFAKYISEPLNFNVDGRVITLTQHEYDMAIEQEARTPNHDLFDAFRRFTKYDDTQLIKNQINNQHAKNVLKLVTKGKNASSSDGTSGAGKIKLPVPK